MADKIGYKKQDSKTVASPIVINNIIVKPTARKTIGIKDWRDALTSYDKGKPKQLMDLYEEILIDNVLWDAMEKRLDAVTQAELVYKDANGERDAVVDKLMDTEAFEEMLKDFLRGKFFGINVEELTITPEADLGIYSIPRKHIRPQYKEYTAAESDERGFTYDFDNFIETDTNSYGIIYRVAQYIIYKRGNYGDWAQYVEIFGQPFRKATYPNHDEQSRKELMKALDECGGGQTAVVPEGANIEIVPGAASGDGSVFEKLRNACNEEILIGILGQTMTTTDGGSLAQSKVHLTVQKDKHKADLKFIARILNSKFLPFLINRGIVKPGGFFLFPEQAEQLSIKDRIQIDEKVIQIVPVPKWYFYERYGIPQPKEGEETVGGPQAEPEPGTGPEPEDKPAAELSAEDKVTLWDKLSDFFVGAPAKGAYNGTLRTNLNDEAAQTPEDDFDTRLIKRVARGESTYFDFELFNEFATQFNRHLNDGYNTIKSRLSDGVGIEYGVQNTAVITAMETNLFHFSAAKTLAEVQQLNQIYRESKSFEEYLNKAQNVTGKFNKAWARTEYETATLVAESAATYQRLRGKMDLFPYWEYKTVGDDKVREEHAALNGVILAASDPQWDEIYPPNGWSCRCYVVPRMKHEAKDVNISDMKKRVEEYKKTPDWSTAVAQHFNVNRGKTNLVFTSNQMYIKKFPEQASKYLNKLTPVSYGLQRNLINCQSKKTESMQTYAASRDGWWAKNAKNTEIAEFKDKNNRTLVLEARQFLKHTNPKNNKYSQRANLLNEINNIIKHPDEVWLNAQNKEHPKPQTRFDNYMYVKHYKDTSLAVSAFVSNGKFTISTWFEISQSSDTRRGLLIYKKTSQ